MGIQVIGLVAHIEHIISEFFLADNTFLFAVDNEVAALVVLTFAHAETDLAVEAIQNTEVRLKHDGKTPEKDVCQKRAALFYLSCFRIFNKKIDLDIVMNGDAIGHVAEAGFIWIHEMFAIFIINNRFAIIEFVAIFPP